VLTRVAFRPQVHPIEGYCKETTADLNNGVPSHAVRELELKKQWNAGYLYPYIIAAPLTPLRYQ